MGKHTLPVNVSPSLKVLLIPYPHRGVIPGIRSSSFFFEERMLPLPFLYSVPIRPARWITHFPLSTPFSLPRLFLTRFRGTTLPQEPIGSMIDKECSSVKRQTNG